MKILTVTGGRADWGLLAPVLALLRDDERFDLRLAATGQHLIEGAPSLTAIHAEGFKVHHLIDIGLGADDSERAIGHAMGRAVCGLADAIAEDRPDLMLVLGDRYEILAAVSAAVVARVPVAHLCGGDITEAAIDDAIRHAITKLSSLHFVTNAESAAHVVQMGEDPTCVFDVGSPGIDRLLSMQRLPRAEFFESVGLAPRQKNVLVTFHPVTLDTASEDQCRAMIDALKRFPDIGVIATGSNADPGGRAIDTLMKTLVEEHPAAVFHISLGSVLYASALSHVDAVVGNSSSGLYEAPTFSVPTVNIGDRQKGRPRASSVIDCAAEPVAIDRALQAALAIRPRGVVNPYGDGRSAERIVEHVASISDPATLSRKVFHTVPFGRANPCIP